MNKILSAMIFSGLMAAAMVGCDGESDSDLVNDVCNKLDSCGYMDDGEVNECKEEGKAEVGKMSSAEKDAIRKCLSKPCSEFKLCLSGIDDTEDSGGTGGSSGSGGGSSGSGGSSSSDSTLVTNLCNKLMSCGLISSSELSECNTDGNEAMSSASSAEKDALSNCASKSCTDFMTCIEGLDG